jgi:membrane associated rhomboid family serine protease/Tfp pilus assembly protein PilF
MQHQAAQRGEDVAYQRVETAPWLRQQSTSMGVTQVVFGANVAVFIAMTLSLGASMLSSPSGQGLVDWGANYGPYTLGGQWWRLLTAVFVHGGLLHIAFNMWCLWDLGRLAESLYGHWTFAILYLICGLFASLASIWWNPGVLSVGASGAIFGIAGALISSFYLGEFSLPRSALSANLRSLLIFAGYNLFFGAVIGHIDNAAHIGGLVIGLILGALIALVAPAQSDIVRRIGVLLLGAAMVAGGVLWLQHSLGFMVHAQNGVGLLSQGKTDQGIAELRKTVAQRPDFVPGHQALARAYVAKHDYENAAAQMQRVIELRPRDDRAYNELGLIYLEQQAFTQAQNTYLQLLKINPNSVDGHIGLASALSGLHQDAESLAEFQRAAAIDPNFPGINYNTGLQQARLGHYDDAIASLLKQRQIADDADNEKLLSDVYTSRKMFHEADQAKAKAEQLAAQK